MKQIIPTGDSGTGLGPGGRRLEGPPLENSSEKSTRPLVEESPARSKTVLIADDDASVCQMLGRVLESEQYKVVRAKTGLDAAAIFLAAPPDLVLLDLNMPVKDGWEAFHLMHAAKPTIPIIIITARPSQQEQATRMGADALMEKPLDLSVLLGTIGKLLAESEAERTQRLNNPKFKSPYLNQRLKTA